MPRLAALMCLHINLTLTQTLAQFFAGYLLEQSLSVDNLFVFILIFTYFKTPRRDQDKVNRPVERGHGVTDRQGAWLVQLSCPCMCTVMSARLWCVH